jgi:hypothetical protein
MDDILNNANKIERMIGLIEELVSQIPDAAVEKANGIANYDRELAITILKMKNGEIGEFEGIEIKNVPATLIPAIAKGICYKACFDKEAGDAGYKGLISVLEARRAQLNGHQSVFKVLS